MTAQCSAITSALNKKGQNTSWLAQQVGSSQQRVDDILSGKAKATQEEFKAIANVLGITSDISHPSVTA